MSPIIPLGRPLAAALAAALMAGCTTLAPDYTRPAAPVPASFPASAKPSGDAPSASNIAWRDYFADPALRDTIAQALENNRDLRVAALNIEKARAQYGIQRAALLPSVGISAGGSAQRLPADLSSTDQASITRRYDATLGFSAFELDFFGRLRSLKDQALAQYLATEEARRSAQVSLVAEVANAWLTLAADRERLDLARRTLLTRQRSLDLTRHRFDAGVASALDLHQQETLFQTARADVARFTAVVAQDGNALQLLVGSAVPPQRLPDTLDGKVSAVAELPAGIPSEVLTRRPDVMQAEHSLRAANASIGAARAAFFPSITLTAAAGTASATLGGLFEGGSRTWSFAPQLNLPIFTAGRLSAQLEVSEAERRIAVARYEQAIQQAFREVADALATRATVGEQVAAQQALAAASDDALRLTRARYERGVDGALQLLDAERSLYAAQQSLITVRLADAANRVVLYKVLGGGWQ